MGCTEGSVLGDRVWTLFRDVVSEGDRVYYAEGLINILESFDCDTIDECLQLLKDSQAEPTVCSDCVSDQCVCNDNRYPAPER